MTQFRARWENQGGTMKPVINRIHVIPVEDGDLLHCAQLSCWCSPCIDATDSVIINHTALTSHSAGWVLIGECHG